MEELAEEAEVAIQKGDLGTLYRITRQLADEGRQSNKPVWCKEGKRSYLAWSNS